MPDLDSIIAAQRIICIKKYLAPRVAGWKFILESYLKKVGGKFLFQCNFDSANGCKDVLVFSDKDNKP